MTFDEMNIALIIFSNLFLLWVESARLRPVGKSNSIPNDRSDTPGGFEFQTSDALLGSKRVRRSIPDWDAANPSYVDLETQQNQHQVINPREEESPFALADHVSSLFRNHKNAKDASQNTQGWVLPGERGLTAVGQEAVEGGMLPPDEQEECYRQQNIDPPPALQRVGPSRRSEKSEMNVSHLAVAPDSHLTGIEGIQGRPFGKTGESRKYNAPGVVLSLYSDPENVSLFKKNFENGNTEYLNDNSFGKGSPYHYDKKISPNRPTPPKKNFVQRENKVNRRVYKPTEFEAEFPVYDKDIEFRPDPLQGILDDKYWVNQQDQESVIKKYINLAINNMVPFGVDIVKRNVESSKSKDKPKFRDDENRCPCNEIASCKDCKKGRQKEIEEEKKSTTSRTDNKENSKMHAKLPSEGNKPNENTISRRLMSFNYDNDDYEESKYNISNFNNNYIGRKLLSWGDKEGEYEENEDEEMRDEILNQENLANKNEKSSSKPLFVNEKRELAHNDYKNYEETFGYSQADRFPSQDLDIFEKYGDSQDSSKVDEDTKNLLENANFSKQKSNPPILQIPLYEISTRNPSYYAPNRLVNMVQKARQEKPKGHPKQNNPEINPNQKFEIIDNLMFQNATLITPSNFNAYEKKTKRKSGNGEKYYFQKGRRSPQGIWSGLKQHPVSNLYQTPDGNKTLSFNQTFTVCASNTTDTNSNITHTPSFPHTTPKMHNNKPKADTSNEDCVDAKIANDIVETVLKESHRDAILGHNLGLCRRNESLMNVNYGKIFSETEKIISSIFDCIMDKMKDRLAKQSCILLDVELLNFLKWMVLTGESYRDYSNKGERLGFCVKEKMPGIPNSSVGTTRGPATTDTAATEGSTNCELESSEGMEFGFTTTFSTYK